MEEELKPATRFAQRPERGDEPLVVPFVHDDHVRGGRYTRELDVA
jgi:hypothetical protein